MAYKFTVAGVNYLSAPVSGLSITPMTIAAWFYANASAAATQRCVCVGQANASNRNQIALIAAATRVQAGSQGPTAFGGSLVSVNFPAGQWVHCAGTFVSTTNRTTYQNGVAATTNTTNVGTLNTPDTISIGAGWATTIGGYSNADIADVGIWNAALTAAEIASLADGMTCDKVRPQSLVFYAPLVRDLVDVKGGLTITNNNTATVANHPRVYA